MREALASRVTLPGVAAAGIGANLLVALALVQHRTTLAVAVVALPVLLVVFALLVRDRAPLVFGALALPMSFHSLNRSYALGGGAHIYTSDILIGLALSSWVVSLVVRKDGLPRWPQTPVARWPVVIFLVPLLVAIERGHAYYGQSLLGQPLRLVLYAGIGAAVADLKPRRAYRGIVAVFYGGTVWMMLNAAYLIATGGSQTASQDLSTGGTRILSISVSLYMAGALFLALLNLQIDRSARRRLLHLTIVVLAGTGVVLGYGRAVYAGVGVMLVVLLSARRIRSAVYSVLPLCLPFLILGGFFMAQFSPKTISGFINRVSASPTSDANVQWREKANKAVWAQVRQSPVYGVGFDRSSQFDVLVPSGSLGVLVPVSETIGQDPHNGFLYILAGGGLVTLVPFLGILATFAFDVRRRLRSARGQVERLLVIWPAATVFVFLLNAASGTEFESGSDLLVIWTLLMLPSVVPLRPGSGADRDLRQARVGRRRS